MKTTWQRPYLPLLILLLIAAGCTTTTPTVTPQPVCTPPPCGADEVYFCPGDCPGGCGTICVTTTPTDNPTNQPTDTPTPIPVCTPPPCQDHEVYFCAESCPGGCGTTCATVTPDTAVPLDWPNLLTWLQINWEAYTDPAQVHFHLKTAGWQQKEEDWLASDFDGDGRAEWALLLYQPDMEAITPHNLWIIGSGGLIYQFYEEPNLIAGYSLQLMLTGAADLTGDGRPELIVNEESCGAHTCFGGYQLLTAANGSLHNIVSNPNANNIIEISYPDASFSDYTQDGLTDFIVHGGQIGSAGAGIVRPYSEVWAWDGTAVTLAATLLDPTPYRHHILYEANDLLAAGDLEQATLLYEQTINDDSLIESPYTGNDEESYASIAQFAAVRLIVIDLMQANEASASSRLDWLIATYPNTAASATGTTLINNWFGGLDSACEVVAFNMEIYPNPTGALEDQGYGNPSLTAADYCP